MLNIWHLDTIIRNLWAIMDNYGFILILQDDDEKEKSKSSHRSKDEARKREAEKRNIDKVDHYCWLDRKSA